MARHNPRMNADHKEPGKGASDETPDATRQRSPERREIGGPKGPEPTRYGDWEKNGRCSDF